MLTEGGSYRPQTMLYLYQLLKRCRAELDDMSSADYPQRQKRLKVYRLLTECETDVLQWLQDVPPAS